MILKLVVILLWTWKSFDSFLKMSRPCISKDNCFSNTKSSIWLTSFLSPGEIIQLQSDTIHIERIYKWWALIFSNSRDRKFGARILSGSSIYAKRELPRVTDKWVLCDPNKYSDQSLVRPKTDSHLLYPDLTLLTADIRPPNNSPCGSKRFSSQPECENDENESYCLEDFSNVVTFRNFVKKWWLRVQIQSE